ncbi:MAG: YicC family protein [Flavobacteriales bacterium]|nr:YicC family protein [Flavobacteriales bacterium]
MIKSMTGFGKAVCNLQGKSVHIEIKSLNSRQLDLNIRTPGMLRDKEPEIRNEIAKWLQRGKVDLNIFVETAAASRTQTLNQKVIQSYHQELKELAISLGEENIDIMPMVMRFPDVIQNEKSEPDENEWFQILNGLKKAIAMLDDFRLREGKSIEEDFYNRTLTIKRLLNNIEGPERTRVPTVGDRIKQQLKNLENSDAVDMNRFEQELIYYLEKMDITEEKTRLKIHCDYFLETLQSNESSGKKLNFISQEIGREVNTIGSKANHAEIQKIVVQMKEELEKIKEQVANIL